MALPPFAHSMPGQPEGKWEPLFTPFGDEPGLCRRESCPHCASLAPSHGHLNKVAYWTGRFAEDMFPPSSREADAARQWGFVVGLWHDLGKFAPEWQNYLASKADPHQAEITGILDHSTAGARLTNERLPLFGSILSYIIAGHHAGLPNGIDSSNSCLDRRLAKTIPEYLPHVPEEILAVPADLPPVPFALQSGCSLGFFLRLLFSALVDADFLATEAFMNPGQTIARPSQAPDAARLEASLEEHLGALVRQSRPTEVNALRAEILGHCKDAAAHPPGLFSLTVPTGGGKTLSSLAFALRHARIHKLRRVVYVIPFTSIIEQNAAIFREALHSLGTGVVVEHHSNLDPDSVHSTITSRLAAENWDAPLVVTTNVQFFESLHANKTSRCRKLHRLARSVVILDEAQSMPLGLLNPCLRSLEELAGHYSSTVVLCTATQPAIHRHEDFPIGISKPREIIPCPAVLYRRLRRVTASRMPGQTSDASLAAALSGHDQALCIVNTRRHARGLFQLLPDDGSRFHLSALMCPEHRSGLLSEVKERLDRKLPVRLVSTQLIEAGVNIDFPVVFRALAGLDSIAQAAGRCDREGLLTAELGRPAGRLFIFDPAAVEAPPFIRTCANSAAQTLAGDPPDPLGLDAIEDYFRRHYWDNRGSTDQKQVLDCYPHQLRSASDLLCFSFKRCAEAFEMIDDYTEPVIVPFGEKGRALCDQLRRTFDPGGIRRLARKLQRFTVAVPSPQHVRLLAAGILLAVHDGSFFLLNSSPHYSETLGLHPEPDITLPPSVAIL